MITWTGGDDRRPNALSLAASAVARIYRSHEEAAGYDAGFDAGEFSGPAHARAERAEIVAALAALGYTPEEYDRELAARTSARFAHFSGLETDELDEDAR